jgi:tetratricopeptide (TPR) repeat protein
MTSYAGDLDDAIKSLQHEWAHIKYETPEDKQEDLFRKLAEKAHQTSQQFPGKAEPLIWEAIIKSTYAGAKGGLGALSLMKEARDLLLAAEKIDPRALNGSIYTSLGSFYYMTPGWPIGFGDDDKAEAYLKKALEIAPEDMDANFFTGDFWLEKKKYKKAIPYFEKVLGLPDVVDRPVYSRGRKAEAAEKLALAKKKAHIK